MKINSTSKFVPSFFNPQNEDYDNFESQPIPTPFRPIDNIKVATPSKINRKYRIPKAFIDDEAE